MYRDAVEEIIEKTIFAYIIMNNDISTIKEFIKIYLQTIDKIDYKFLKDMDNFHPPKKDIKQPYVSRRFQKYGISKDQKSKNYVIENHDYLLLQNEFKKKFSDYNIKLHSIISSDIDENIDITERTGLYFLTLEVPYNYEKSIAKTIYDELKLIGLNIFTSIIPGICSVTMVSKYYINTLVLESLLNCSIYENEKHIADEQAIIYYDYIDECSNSKKNNIKIIQSEISTKVLAALGDMEAQKMYEYNDYEALKEVDDILKKYKPLMDELDG